MMMNDTEKANMNKGIYQTLEELTIEIARSFHCYGALIRALQNAWVKDLVDNWGLTEEEAREAAQ
jgi:hypothetical protein